MPRRTRPAFAEAPLPSGRTCEVVIHLDALRHNLAKAREAAGEARIMAAIKANGYGHGLIQVANALAGADGLGVASIDEALQLREAGLNTPLILLEGFFHRDELDYLAGYRIATMLHQPWQVAALEETAISGPIEVWIKVDSGMHRLGFSPSQVKQMWERVRALPQVRCRGFMTHLACADDLKSAVTGEQLKTFEEATAGLPGERAIANSAGLLGWPESRADWVRPGIMLYGVSPFIGGRGGEHDLQSAMTLRSELIAVNHLQRGARVGYGGSWSCPDAMPVGVVAVGYGDGYPRHAASGTPVLVNGMRVPLIGRVSMDMITVDLRSQPQAKAGDPAVLWGRGLPIEEVAESAGTIAYELMCQITSRVRRIEHTDGRQK